MTPATTIGVCCVPTPANVHAVVSRDTLVVLICVSLEYLVPARSPANRGQSASVKGLTPACRATTWDPTAIRATTSPIGKNAPRIRNPFRLIRADEGYNRRSVYACDGETNSRRHGFASMRAMRLARECRALSVAIPVFAYIWRYSFEISTN